MNIKKELNNGSGFVVFEIENMKVFKNLRKLFLKNIQLKPKDKKNINLVRKKLTLMSRVEANRSMINFLTFNKDLSEMMINSCPSMIKKICGKELFIQRRAHTTINIPGKDHTKQWTHYEMISGISPFTYIIWAPLHDLDDNGGAYHIDLKTSLKIMRKEEKEGLVNGPRVLNMMGLKNPPRLKFGQGIIFNPFVLHGNISFKSKLARIACNVRFQSSKKPLLQKNTDYLKYYYLN
jgi:sporadic carbohydrate cluster 2OG-Fe(II) oxygenase